MPAAKSTAGKHRASCGCCRARRGKRLRASTTTNARSSSKHARIELAPRGLLLLGGGGVDVIASAWEVGAWVVRAAESIATGHCFTRKPAHDFTGYTHSSCSTSGGGRDKGVNESGSVVGGPPSAWGGGGAAAVLTENVTSAARGSVARVGAACARAAANASSSAGARPLQKADPKKWTAASASARVEHQPREQRTAPVGKPST